jgi:SpoVK/Ycf46/Vps4 family AAA+-type ATPase
MSELKQELSKLAENLKNYTKETKDSLVHKTSETIDAINNKFAQAGDVTSQELQREKESLIESYEHFKNATSEKEKEMYDKLVKKLDELNKKF